VADLKRWAKMKKKIDLSSYCGIGVIVSCASEVLYSNQTQGHACEHPEEEGAFLPLPQIGQEFPAPLIRRLQEHFDGSWEPILISDADFVDGELRSLGLDFVEVDRTRLDDSFESWIRVRFRRATDFALGFDGASGVLTWPNSD
jgi:hypothetical protein